MGISRYTLSRLKEDIEAMFPVLKNADWRRVRKNREVRRSERVKERKGEDVSDAGMTDLPFVWGLVSLVEM